MANKVMNNFRTISNIKKKEKIMDKYICTLCQYEYDPAENDGIAFEDLPEDYVCPLCGAGKEVFEKE